MDFVLGTAWTPILCSCMKKYSGTTLSEASVERVISAAEGLDTGHLPIWLDSVLQTEELPMHISDVDASLAAVDTDGLMHVDLKEFWNPPCGISGLKCSPSPSIAGSDVYPSSQHREESYPSNT